MKHPLYYFQWDDHWGGTGSWSTLPTKDETVYAFPCETIGWVVREEEKGYLVASTRCRDFDRTDRPISGLMYILKSAVTKKKRITL